MISIALYEPEIPPNTGNIIRLCANSGAQLHLIHPLGFALNEKSVRRAGLDYHEWAQVNEHDNFEQFWANAQPKRLFALTTKASTLYTRPNYQPGDCLLFGPESRGLPMSLLNHMDESKKLKIPMQPNSRSLNLSNTVAIVLFEAWRQLNFQSMVGD